MKKKWSQMTPTEKKLMVLLWIYIIIALVFAVLDLSGTWKNVIPWYMIAAFCAVEGVVEWKKNWKMSLLNFAIAVVFLIEAISM